MNRWMKRFGAVLALALVAVLALGAVTFAQGPDNGDGPPAGAAARGGFFPGPGDPGFQGGEEHLQSVAEALGMTVEEMQAALDAGQSLRDLAAEKGVDLHAVMVEQAQERLAQAVADGKLTQEQADAILKRIENGEFPRPHGRRGSSGRRGPGIEAVADALGMTVEELQAALADGKTPQEIAAEKGIDLHGVMVEQAQERLAQAVADGKLTQEQADAILERTENGEFPRPHGRRGSSGRRGPGSRGPGRFFPQRPFGGNR